MIHTLTSKQRRPKRVIRIRKKIRGTSDRPRLSLFRSNTALYVQCFDDDKRVTLIHVSTKKKNMTAAKELALAAIEKMKKLGITTVVFDRGGNKYHGVVKAFVDGIREGGIRV